MTCARGPSRGIIAAMRKRRRQRSRTERVFSSGGLELHHGDCRDLIRALPPRCLDSIVTDPPYSFEFLGQAWDRSHRNPAHRAEFWTRVKRVLKPGAHVVAFGAERTIHRIMVALEDAGFELRHLGFWATAQGMPKGRSIGRLMDQQRNDDIRPVCRFLRQAMERAGVSSREIAERFEVHSRMVDHWAARDTDSQPTVPTMEQWHALKRILGMGTEMDGWVAELNRRKGTYGEAWQDREKLARMTKNATTGPVDIAPKGTEWDITRPREGSDAEKWEGWSTTLKTCEPFVIARAPLEFRTVVENVKRYGTGAINIDACRIPYADPSEADWIRATARPHTAGQRADGVVDNRPDAPAVNVAPGGRWPSSVMVSDLDVEAMVHVASDEDDGLGGLAGSYTRYFRIPGTDGRHDEALASLPPDLVRALAPVQCFVPKASTTEREAGLFPGDKRRRNTHVAVKPVALIRHLSRLVTPPGGRIFDPFMGAGSGAVAAVWEGFEYLGCELFDTPEDPYVSIALERASYALETEAPETEPRAPDTGDHGLDSLFEELNG